MLQSNAMCNVSLPDLLNTVNKSGNVRIYVTFKYTLTRLGKKKIVIGTMLTFAAQKRIEPW